MNAFLRSFFPGYVCAREHMLQEGLVKDWMACCASRKLKLCRNNLKQLERSWNAFLGFLWFLSQELMQRDTERNKEWKRPGLEHASTTKMMRSSHPRGWLHSFLSLHRSFYLGVMAFHHGVTCSVWGFFEVEKQWQNIMMHLKYAASLMSWGKVLKEGLRSFESY